MKIAIVNLTGGRISEGYRKYLLNVIPRMAESPVIEEILCVTPESIKLQDRFEFLPKVNFIACKPFNFLYYTPEREFKKALEIFSPDIMFIPVERYFKFDKVPIVNMIQNMEPFAESIYGNSFTDKCRFYFQRLVAKRAMKKSDRVIAISRYVREFLSNTWGISEGKIGLVYHGIGLPHLKEYIRPKNIPKDWEGNFLFTAGSIRPARGLEDILGAMKYLILEKVNIKGVVISGKTESRMVPYRKKLEEWIKINNLSSKIYWTGKLSEREMSWCYRNCKMFVMTSRVESFGMIAGEAMAYGCVCVSSDSPCLPEIFGEAAVFYLHNKVELLAETIKSVSEWDNYQRDEISKKARERAIEFSWDVTVERLLAEFKKAIESVS
jgi:glycosyltransferase involved in cell wall biosynthesis